MTMRTRPGLLTLAAALAVVLGVATACGGSSSKSASGSSTSGASNNADATQGVATNSLDFGVMSDQSGATTSTQVPFSTGVKTFFAKVNAAGGVNGRKINPITCDDQYMVAPAIACLKKFISDTPVVGLNGLNNASARAAALTTVQAAKIPLIGPEGNTKESVNPFPGYLWATECSYPTQADVAVAYAFKKLGKTNFTAVGLGGNVSSAADYLGNVKERLEKGGATYKTTVQYTFGQPNMDQEAQQIAQLKPDVIFTHGGTAQNVTFFKSLEKYGVTNTLIIGIYAQETDAVAQSSETVGKNYYAVNCYSNAKQTDVPGVKDMVAAAKANNVSSDIYNTSDFTNGYVTGMVIVAGLQKAGHTLTRASLNAAMSTINNLNTQGLSPTISFSTTNSDGVQAARPYKFNYTSGVWDAQGAYSDYAKCNAREYTTGNIDAWQPNCITGG